AEPLNYVRALYHGLARLDGGFPLSNRLLREIHAILLADTRGRNQDPGHFRRTQNWIGGSRPGNARYVPPPPQLVAPEAEPRRVLRPAPARPDARRVGGVGALLPRRGCRRRRLGDGDDAAAARPRRAGSAADPG